MENIKTMSRMLQMRDQMLEQEGPLSDFFDDFGAEPRVGLLGLSGVEDEGGGRCRILESFTPAPCNNNNNILIFYHKVTIINFAGKRFWYRVNKL